MQLHVPMQLHVHMQLAKICIYFSDEQILQPYKCEATFKLYTYMQLRVSHKKLPLFLDANICAMVHLYAVPHKKYHEFF
jgi:hypothetical protein